MCRSKCRSAYVEYTGKPHMKLPSIMNRNLAENSLFTQFTVYVYGCNATDGYNKN